MNKELTYNDGLKKAWEIAQKLAKSSGEGGYTSTEIADIFDDSYWFVLRNYTIEEVMQRIEHHKESKKIHVGDIVMDEDGLKGICVSDSSYNDDLIEVWYDDYLVPQDQHVSMIKKTGEHVDVQTILNLLHGRSDKCE